MNNQERDSAFLGAVGGMFYPAKMMKPIKLCVTKIRLLCFASVSTFTLGGKNVLWEHLIKGLWFYIYAYNSVGILTAVTLIAALNNNHFVDVLLELDVALSSY